MIEDGPTFHANLKQWVIAFTLRRESGAQFIGTTTPWCALVDDDYPFGGIAIHPAAKGGITATFPHQSANTPSPDGSGWRGGKLCLDVPLGDERRFSFGRDPRGDSDSRLRWHVERALLWLDRAANDQLLGPGDPFEAPAHIYTTARAWLGQRVVHDETARTFSAWSGREGTLGVAELGTVSDIGDAITVGRFRDRDNSTVREWAGRELTSLENISGFWWLWPKPIVLAPWQAPRTWGELRRIAKTMGLDADGALRWLLASIRGAKTSNILLVGYPVPLRIGAPDIEVHWDALLLPPVRGAGGKPPSGFRANARGWWQRDRYGTFADKVVLQYLYGENWSSDRLQARGRLSRAVRDSRIALLGVGALGSAIAEMLVRAGVRQIALVDGDLLQPGNVCRHTATLVEVGKAKVQVVAQRLRQISPSARVTEVLEDLRGTPQSIVQQFEEYDVVVDCTASDDALRLLATAWWSIPRVLASFSMGYGAKRLFSFGVSGHRFPHDVFAMSIRPWLEHEAQIWANSEEVLEGAGCWSPLFPARHDDVVMQAATCMKELESLVAKRPTTPQFRVFAQASTDDGFQGSVLESAPPALEAIAS